MPTHICLHTLTYHDAAIQYIILTKFHFGIKCSFMKPQVAPKWVTAWNKISSFPVYFKFIQKLNNVTSPHSWYQETAELQHIQHAKRTQPTQLNFMSKFPVPHLCHGRLSYLEGAVISLFVVLLKWRYPIIQCLISLFWLLSSLGGTPQYKQFTYCTQKGANQGNYCFAAPICQLWVRHWLGWKCAIVCPVHAWTSSENNAMWITPGW